MGKSASQLARRAALAAYGNIENGQLRVAELYRRAEGKDAESENLFLDVLSALELARNKMAEFIVGAGYVPGAGAEEEEEEEA